MLDLKAQYAQVGPEIEAKTLDVLRSGQYILGPETEALEEELAKYCGVAYGVGVSSGTDALLVALMALDVGPGDLVVMTPYSFFATAGVVARLNAKPVFVDIDPVTYNIDPSLLKASFESGAIPVEKVKAILPVHLYGQCADMAPILGVAQAFDVAVIEDAAQAIGAGYPIHGRTARAGSMGLAGCFSFYPTKNLNGIGDGGMVVSQNPNFADRVRQLRNHGAERTYYHTLVGGNFRIDALQAAALRVKLRYLDEWNAKRRENAAYYDKHLNVEGLRTPAVAYGAENHIYHQYVISVPDRRDALRDYLAEKGIGTSIYYPVPFHLQPCFAGLGAERGDFPNTEYAADHTLALPIYPELTRDMQDYVIENVSAFYSG